MKSGILIIALCLNACAWTPKDEAWRTSLETAAPEGIGGNCLPVAQALQQIYGGTIAVIKHPKKTPNSTHAVLLIGQGQVLDNGTVGYLAQWDDLMDEGWQFKYWWEL